MSAPYGAVVLEHFRRPRNRGALSDANRAREGVNPLCGDRVRIELRVRDEVVEDAAFSADACAICIASASLLTERVRGMSVAGAAAITDESAIAALGASIPAAREACAVLPAATLRRAVSAPPSASPGTAS